MAHRVTSIMDQPWPLVYHNDCVSSLTVPIALCSGHDVHETLHHMGLSVIAARRFVIIIVLLCGDLAVTLLLCVQRVHCELWLRRVTRQLVSIMICYDLLCVNFIILIAWNFLPFICRSSVKNSSINAWVDIHCGPKILFLFWNNSVKNELILTILVHMI